MVQAGRVSVASSHLAVAGSYLPVTLSCLRTRAGIHDAARGRPCSGVAEVTTQKGALLARASYSVANGKVGTAMLRLTPVGSRALASADAHPVDGRLTVSVAGSPAGTGIVVIA